MFGMSARVVQFLLDAAQLLIELLDPLAYLAHGFDLRLALGWILHLANIFGNSVALGFVTLYHLNGFAPLHIQGQDLIDRSRIHLPVNQRMTHKVWVFAN
jgi:hypothetical protein